MCGVGGGSVCVVMGLNRLIGVSWVFVCVALCVESVLEVEGEREGKKRLLESLGKPKVSVIKKRLKNNILIKIEFWDVGGIVKWDGIIIKWLFRMVK